MEEIVEIIDKYKDTDLEPQLSSFDSLKNFSVQFYGDVAEIYDALTRLKNLERNPTGFIINDAAILGLLIRIWKILKEAVYYYRKNNADIISLLDRIIVESAVIAKYLLLKGDDAIEDYRKCSYKDRLRILTDANRSPDFFNSPPGKRLKQSIIDKMNAEGLTLDSFKTQEQNRWRLSGKNFFEIFREIEPPEFYKYLYGIPSESVHGSWNESMDYNLTRNDDNTFSTYPFYQDVDIRFITPLIRITNDPYLLWLDRIEANSEYLRNVFKWINSVNAKLFTAFEPAYKSRNEENAG